MSVVVVNASGNQDIDGILWGWRWGQTNITFSFPTSSSEYASYAQVNGFASFSTFQANAVRQALNLIAGYANITFSETTTAGAQFRFAKATSIDYTDDSSVAQNTGLNTINTAQGNPPTATSGSTPPFTPTYAQGDTWFNPSGYNNPTIGSFQDAAGVMHEIGHDMGLKHGHVTQSGHGVTFPTLPTNHDSYEYSVMTYQQFPDDSPSNGDSAPDHPTSYMQDDIAAMQYMYGANYNTNNGNTTYTWDTTGAEYINGTKQFNLNGEAAPADHEIFQTIWDGGGTDTYDLSNFTTNESIDLSPGGWVVLDTSTAHSQRADLGFDSVTNSEYFARGNIANALIDPNNPNETASLIENATGGSGADQIYGNSANNTLKGGGGNDLLEGGDGDDYLYGGSLLSSNDGDDTLKGGGGDDHLYGGDGNDSLKGGGGADVLDGGTGVNTADYTQSAVGVNVNLVTGTGSGGEAQGDTLVNIQILQGSSYGDTLVGDATKVNSLYGNSGDDFIYAGGAGSTMDGGAGTSDLVSFFYMTSGVTVDLSGAVAPGGAAAGDTIANFEQLDGSNSADTLYGNSGANYIYGEGGNDVINAGDGADYVYAGNGDDRVVDTDYINFDSYNGGIGVNTIDYSGVTFAGAGVVTINLQTGVASVTTSGGNTEQIVNFQNVEGSQGGETIIGSDAANVLDGNGGDDVIQAGGGNDTLSGGKGADSLDGGTGNNTASYKTSTAGVNVNLSTGTGTGGDAQGDTLVNIQNLIGSAYGDTLTGDNNDNILNGALGPDTMVGLGGHDIYYVDNPGDVVKEAVGGGSDHVLTSVSYTLTAGSEIELFSTTNDAGTGAINLTGNTFSQTIYGNAGANVINGGGGNDTLVGYGGNDTYYVDSASDIVHEATNGGYDVVLANTSYTLTAGQSIEKLATTNIAGTGSINLTGNALSQTINGNAGANVIDGGGGGDIMNGGGGNDTYYVRSASDVVNEATNGGYDAVIAAVSYVLAPNQSIEKLTTISLSATTPINLTGNNLGQAINGNAGNNVIDGGDGDDTLQGLGGNDTFVFDTTLGATNIDKILDFSVSADKISLAHSIFSTLATGTLAAQDFFIGTAAQNANEHILYNSSNGWLSYDSDGNGAAAATHFATLSTALAMKNTNFTVT